MIRVLSLGAGVQSSTLLLMAAAGELDHVPDAAIFADTGWEPKAVYEWLDWLEDQVRGVIPIHRVQRRPDARGNTSIRDAFSVTASTGKRFVQLPVFTRNRDGSRGRGRRQCTKEFKIEPIHQKVRELAGVQPRSPGPRSVVVEQWMGISMDEVVRMKPSRVRWVQHRFPLIERGLTRSDCLRWWERRGLPTPPKSACIGCPYTDDRRWRDMKERAPAEFASAVAFDHEIRELGAGRENYIHDSLQPLDQVDFSTAEERGQGHLFDGFADECEGMCGV